MNIDYIRDLLSDSKYSNITVIGINHNSFVFEERIKQKCYHCKNYGTKWTCPPNIPNVDYNKMFHEYENIVVLRLELSLENADFEEQRTNSTNHLHRALLYLENEMYKQNNSTAISFIGGSCKLCKNGCGSQKCINPYLSRMPWEATGCNIIKTMKNEGYDIEFPLKEKIYRYGLFLW